MSHIIHVRCDGQIKKNIQTRLKEECLTEFQTLMLDKLIATFKKMGKSKSNYPITYRLHLVNNVRTRTSSLLQAL